MIFHVDLDAFFASIEQRDNKALAGKPVIVGGPSRHRGVVAAASYEARKYGIHSAMPLSQAFRLCQSLILVPPDFKKYTRESKIFYKTLYSFTPFIEQVSIDEAYTSFYGFESYYEDFVQLGHTIKRAIVKKLDITASIGIATNKVVSKIASNKQKPDGLTIVKKGDEKPFLTPLPLRDLPGLGIKTEEQLTQLEIRTLGELSNVPLTKLKTLFGKHGEHLYYASNGIGDKSLTMDWERKSLGAETTFLFDSNDREFLEQTLYFLTLRATFNLRLECKKATGITVKIRSSSFQTQTHQGKLSFATNNTKQVYERAKELFYEAWDGRSLLRLIGLSLFDLTKKISQETLFEPLERRSQNVEATLDNLREKHGFWSIYPASLLKEKTTLKRLAKTR